MNKIFIFVIFFTTLAFAKSPTLFGPNNTSLNLQSNLQLTSTGPGFYQGSSDPTSVAVSANKTSLYLDTSNGNVYVKQDNGLSTNWTALSAGSSTGTPNDAAYFNGLGNLSSEANLATSRGGTHHGNYTAKDIPFADALGTTLTEDPGYFAYDSTNHALLVGNSVVSAPGIFINSTSTVTDLSSTAFFNYISSAVTADNFLGGSATVSLINPKVALGVTDTGEYLGNVAVAYRSDAADLGAIQGAGAFDGYIGNVTGNPGSTTVDMFGLRLGGVFAAGGGTITNLYDMYVLPTNSTGITITNRYGLYISPDSARTKYNYLGGNTMIGGIYSTPSAALDVNGTFRARSTSEFDGAMNMTSHKINNVTDPTSSQDAATKNYVDTQLAQLNPLAAVYAASVANIAGTYTNAVVGVCIGDTFTTTATTNFALDGTSPPVGSRVLLKNQGSSFQDGVWVLTTQAVGGISGAILTRALDSDSSASFNAGQIVPVVNGTQAGSSWYQTAVITTCSSDIQTWTKFQNAASAYLLSANNLSDVASKTTAFNNVSPLSAKGDLIVFNGANNVAIGVGSDGQVLTADSAQASGVKWAAASGSSGLNAKFTLNDAVVPYINIDGPHYQTSVQTLSSVNISMLNSGDSGDTVIQMNQFRSGALLRAVTASAVSSNGTPVGVAASLSGNLNLQIADVITVDISSTAKGAPEAITVEY